ncbi:hypothetical protein AB0L70_04475 [Kribbella sp. NPDC051952]|uniref:hypothetical protein n=1 Tax=Kribbella sp. NPDC051952 TaxID=3154851 RepID=UPI00344046E9
MTALEVPGAGINLRSILDLGLPAHVLVNLDGTWIPAWLIGRVHCANGWIAQVQCLDPTGAEQTVRVPAERIALSTARRPGE